LRRQHWVVQKVKADWPLEPLVPIAESATNEVVDHGDKLLEVMALGSHFWLVANCHQRLLILLYMEDQFFAHALSLHPVGHPDKTQ